LPEAEHETNPIEQDWIFENTGIVPERSDECFVDGDASIMNIV
jgi:hypothetical protein